MAATIYYINKGINQPLYFKGFQAQYVSYLAILLVLLMLLCASLFFIGFSPYICLILVMSAGSFLIGKLHQMSRRYGRFGLLKAAAARKIPHSIRNNSRGIFMHPDRYLKPKELTYAQ